MKVCLLQCYLPYKQIGMSEYVQCHQQAQQADDKELKQFKHSKSRSLKIMKNKSVWSTDRNTDQARTVKQHLRYSPQVSSDSQGQEQPAVPMRQDDKFLIRYNQLNSLPINRIASSLSHKSTLEPIAEEFIKLKQKINANNILLHKCQQIVKDKQKFPIKYKMAEEFGYDEQKVFRMKDSELRRVQSEYMKQKGIQYLQQNRQIAKLNRKLTGSKTEHYQDKGIQPQPIKKDPNYVRQIFKEAAVIVKAREQVRLEKKKKEKKLQVKLKHLSERQDLLGFLVYAKTHKHLKKVKTKELGYLQQLKSEEKIDASIIEFIKSKVKRARTEFK